MNLVDYLFPVLLGELTVMQKSCPSTTQVFSACGIPSRSHGESIYLLHPDLLPHGNAGLEWEAIVRTGRCPAGAVLLQLSRGCKPASKLAPGRWELPRVIH